MKNHTLYIGLAVVLLLSCGCTAKTASSTTAVSTVNSSSVPAAEKPRASVSFPASKRLGTMQVAVFSGSSFKTRPEILTRLAVEYGLPAEGGLLLPVSTLNEVTAVKSAGILLVLSAPDSSRALARIRSLRPDIRIISIFPLDDILSVEGASDLVIDHEASTEMLAAESVAPLDGMTDGEVSFLLLAASLAAEKTDASVSPLDRFTAALSDAHARNKKDATGEDWKVTSYVDPDTGLRSRNHLILETPVVALPQ